MTDALLVEFVPIEDRLELTARSEHGAASLVIEAARASRTWPFGATLDGALTLDLDDEHVLVHADLMGKRSRWKKGAVSLPNLAQDVQGLRLPNLSIEALADQEVRVTPVFDGSTLVIWLDEPVSDRRTPLGPGVSALTRASTLAGLAVEIA